MSFTIQNVLIPVDAGYDTVDVQIEGDRFTSIAPKLDPVGTVVDGRNKLLLPGFVNGHTHSSEMWLRGYIRPVPLELWLGDVNDFSPLDPEKVYLSALLTGVETLLSGGTSVLDHLSLIPGKEIETVEAAVRAYRDVGIRAFVGPLIQDEPLTAAIPSGGKPIEHEPYFRSTADTLALMAEVVAKFHRPEEGINILVGATGFQLCSDALLEGCVELSDRHNLCRHCHLLETKAQKKLAQEKYGCSAVAHLQRLGYLGSRTSLAHAIWLDDAEIEILAQTQSTIVHNPLSNLRLGSGIAPVLKYRQAGVNVSFGCDGAASNDSQDLLEAIKLGSILHNVTDLDYRHWLTPRQAVEMAALGGVRGLNMEAELGSLTVGKKADVVLYDLKNLSILPRTDPIGLLILGRPVQVVDSAWVNGDRVIAAGQFTKIDLEDLKEQLFTRSQWNANGPSQLLPQFEPQYREVMDLTP